MARRSADYGGMADEQNEEPMPLWKRLLAAGLVVGGVVLFLYMLTSGLDTGLPG